MFCGQLEARFPVWAIKNTARPGFGLAEPCKSRLFPALTVHSRPPFPFTFCFLPPVNSGGAVRAVFPPVGFWEKGLSAYGAAFRVLIPENLRLQRPVQRQDRPAEPLAADGTGDLLRAGAGVPVVKGDTVAVLTAAALPAYQAGRLFPLRRCHAVKGTVRLAFQRWQVFIGVISHAFPPFFAFTVRPEKASCPIPAACSGVGTLPAASGHLSRSDLWTKCPEIGSLRCFPCRGIPFRTVIHFSRCSSSMNYHKSTLFRPPVPYIHKVGNPPKKLPISTLSELW